MIQKKSKKDSKAGATESGVAPAYLHGFSQKEQDRLYRQARFLEPRVFEKVDFSKANRIIEVGCGVGAQTEILLERFPHLTIEAIDASPEQVAQAKKRLAKQVKQGRVSLRVADALRLPFPENSFDGAFCSWFLEHVQRPVEILRETRRVLKAHSSIYCTEPMNATFFVHPYSPATLQIWFEENDYQWEMKGDPFVGGKLANYLLKAGYQNIFTEVKVDHYDNRAPKTRADHIEYWTDLLLSGTPDILKAGKITPKAIDEMKKELAHLKEDPDSVFFICWVQAHAQAF